MKDADQKHIAVIDKDSEVERIVRSVCNTLNMRIGNIVSFEETQKFSEWLRQNVCDLVIADPVTVGMSGVDLVAKIREVASAVPIILTSRSPELDEAVKAVEAGAETFIEKPIEEELLLSFLGNALWQSETGESLLDRLFSKTERKVLQLTLEGKSIDEIAKVLHRSRKAILFCRHRIGHKLGFFKLVWLKNWHVELRWRDSGDWDKTYWSRTSWNKKPRNGGTDKRH